MASPGDEGLSRRIKALEASAAALLITEAQLQRRAVDLLHACRWEVFHDRVAWRSDPGYPDLTAVNPVLRRCLWVEVKTSTGRLSSAQQTWRDVLRAAGAEWFELRPSTWDAFVRLVVPPEMLTEEV